MLNLNNMEAIVHPEIEQLLVDLRRVQVSRFPIDTRVNQTGDMVAFIDSRFPTDAFSRAKNLAILYFDGYDKKSNKKIFTVESRLIQNDKYSSRSAEYYTKSSSDVKKVAKLLRDFVKPYSGLEVASQSRRLAEEYFTRWRDKPMSRSREVMGEIYRDHILEMFALLKERGVTPVDARMQKIYDEAVPAYQEAMSLRDNKFAGVHVSINPDESVVVTCSFDNEAHGVTKGTITHESMEACPAYVQTQISMLRIVDDHTHLPNVGYRVDDKTFWIDTLPQEK